jgi:O-antigen/teichoic acid export membrane protein
MMASSLVHGLTWTVGGDLVGKAAFAGTTAGAARLLVPQDFAIMVGLMASGALGAAVWDTGVATLLTRQVAAGRIDALTALAQALRLRLVSAPLWLGVYVVSAFGLLRVGMDDLPAAGIFAVASILSGLSVLPISVLRASGDYRRASMCVAVGRCAGLIGTLWLVMGRSHSLMEVSIAMAAAELVTLSVAVYSVRSVVGRPRTAMFTEALTLRKAAPLAVNGVLSTAYNRFDVVLLPALATLAQLRAYAPASRIQDALYLVPGSIGLVALPYLSRTWAARGSTLDVARVVRRLMILGLVICVPAALVFSLFAGTVLRVFLGPNYEEATTAVRILVWFLPFAAIGAPLLAGLIAVGRAKDTVMIFGATFAGALVFHLALDPRFGAVGAAVASLLRDPVGLVAAVLLCRRCGIFRLRISASEVAKAATDTVGCLSLATQKGPPCCHKEGTTSGPAGPVGWT